MVAFIVPSYCGELIDRDTTTVAVSGGHANGSGRCPTHFARHPKPNHARDLSSRSAVVESKLSGNGDLLFQHNLSLAVACIVGHSHDSDRS
jgi:hypothetical protein